VVRMARPTSADPASPIASPTPASSKATSAKLI
jgi:hypothetical protein